MASTMNISRAAVGNRVGSVAGAAGLRSMNAAVMGTALTAAAAALAQQAGRRRAQDAAPRAFGRRQQAPSASFRASNFGNRRASGRAESCRTPGGMGWGGRASSRDIQDFFQQLQDFERAWSSGSSSSGPQKMTFPLLMDLEEEEEAFVYQADVPGVTKADIKLQINREKRLMTLTAERKPTAAAAASDSEDAPRRRRRFERPTGTFRRNIQLPKNADLKSINARTDNGVLTVRVGKVAPSEPDVTEIPINGDTWPAAESSADTPEGDVFDV